MFEKNEQKTNWIPWKSDKGGLKEVQIYPERKSQKFTKLLSRVVTNNYVLIKTI